MWVAKNPISGMIYGRYDSLEEAEIETSVLKQTLGIELVIEKL